ncbi:MAG: GNAT family N-acetyltransferase [Alphaproteobacteria bacterium]|nr:GNAT family N-acetyltransferase [Alphaproteobacteria bacterium]
MASRASEGWTIVRVSPDNEAEITAAGDLLIAFFAEEGLATPPDRIKRNLIELLAAPSNAVLLARASDGTPLGVATLTSAPSIEQGRVAELEDLYVMPAMRRDGLGRALVKAAVEIARDPLGCETVAVVVTAHGQHDLGLIDYYLGLGFVDLDRKMLLMDVRQNGAEA